MIVCVFLFFYQLLRKCEDDVEAARDFNYNT
jgi:hypothetical protein